MRVLVSDTSILIDLERGGLLESVFGSGLVFAVPDLLYARELEGEFGDQLRALGLVVAELSGKELGDVQALHDGHSSLSLADCSALCCAMRPDHVLLTGDRVLKREAEARRVTEVHGLLWLLDQALEGGVSPADLHAGLLRIRQDERCRLPQGEVDARLARWAQAPA